VHLTERLLYSEDVISWNLGTAAGSITYQNADTAKYRFSVADGGDAELRITDLKAEEISIYASYGSVLSASSSPLVVHPAAADTIFILGGNGQVAVVNTQVTESLRVGVEDTYGNRVPGISVSFSALSNGTYVDADAAAPGQQLTSTTDQSGVAVCEYLRLGTKAQVNSDSVRAEITSDPSKYVLFTASAVHDSLASIELSPKTKNITVGTQSGITAHLTDQYGNPVIDENITIFIKDMADGFLSNDPAAPTDSLGPTTRAGRSDSLGVVSVLYNAPSAAGAQDIIDAYHVYLPADSVEDAVFTSVAAGATDLEVVAAPDSSMAGLWFSFVVEAVDGNGNRDLSNTSVVNIIPESGSDFTFSLSMGGPPVASVALSSGAATVYGRGTKSGIWSIDLIDAASVLTSTSFSITVSPNDTVDHYVVDAPSSVTAGQGFSVSVTAFDRFENVATGAGYRINFDAVSAADSTVPSSDTLSITNGFLADGVYSGQGFRYNVAEPIRIRVSDDSTSVAGYSGVIVVDNAASYRLVKLSSDSTGVMAGDSVAMELEVLDVYGNPADGEVVTFTVQAGGGSLQNQSMVTDASGRVYNFYHTGVNAGYNEVRAAILDGAPPELETQSFHFSTVPNDSIAYVVLSIDGDDFRAGDTISCNVAAYDRYDNLLTTDSTSMLLPVAEMGSVAFIPDTLVLEGGVTAFHAVDTIVGSNRIAILSLSGDTLAPLSAPYTISPGYAYDVVKVSGDTTGVVAGSDVVLRVRVRDRYGNRVDGEIVRFSIISELGGSPSLRDGTAAPDDGITLTDAGGGAVCTLTTDTNAGLNLVSASILDADPPGLEKVVFGVSTVAGNIVRYDVIPDGYSKVAGETFSVSVVGYDSEGNVAYGDDSTKVELGSSGAAVFSADTVTLNNGSAVVTVVDTVAEKLVLSAQTVGGGALSYSDTVDVSPQDPWGTISFFSIAPDTITADGASKTTITTNPITDRYGNVVSQGTAVAIVATSGEVASEDQVPSTPGVVERLTGKSGRVSVFVRSAVTPGVDSVSFNSTSGNASGVATVVYAAPPSVTYDGYLSPRTLAPGDTITFSCSVVNNSPTGVYIDPSSFISFSDSLGREFRANLGSPVFVGAFDSDTLVFAAAELDPDFIGGSYTPAVSISGNDIYAAPYSTTFNVGANSVVVSQVGIVRVLSHKAIVSRGDTFVIDVEVQNSGAAVIRVSSIDLKYSLGQYSSIGGWSPSLPDTLLPGSSKVYSITQRVLPGSPVGPDTIDASVTANVDGMIIHDFTAYPDVATILVQSAAAVSYRVGSLAPRVVSLSQNQSFSLSLENTGEAAVILDPARTSLSFNDGADTFRVFLAAEEALPGYNVAVLGFPPGTIPASMQPGAYPVALHLGAA